MGAFHLNLFCVHLSFSSSILERLFKLDSFPLNPSEQIISKDFDKDILLQKASLLR